MFVYLSPHQRHKEKMYQCFVLVSEFAQITQMRKTHESRRRKWKDGGEEKSVA